LLGKCAAVGSGCFMKRLGTTAFYKAKERGLCESLERLRAVGKIALRKKEIAIFSYKKFPFCDVLCGEVLRAENEISAKGVFHFQLLKLGMCVDTTLTTRQSLCSFTAS